MLPFPCTFCWNPAGPGVPAEPQGDQRSRSSPENSCSDFCCCGWHQHHLGLNMSSLLEPGAPRQSCCSSSFYFFFHLENVFVLVLFLFLFLIFFSGSRRVIYRIYGSFLSALPKFPAQSLNRLQEDLEGGFQIFPLERENPSKVRSRIVEL